MILDNTSMISYTSRYREFRQQLFHGEIPVRNYQLQGYSPRHTCSRPRKVRDCDIFSVDVINSVCWYKDKVVMLCHDSLVGRIYLDSVSFYLFLLAL